MTTSAELRARANEAEQEAADSFERCDTDGFLSQWASTLTARKLRAQADLADAGGEIECSALFNLDGTVASTHLASGKYGPFWVLNDEATERFGKRFYTASGAAKAATRRRNNRAKGFTIGTIRVKGYVTIAGSGKGLSGAASAYVATVADVGELKAGRFTVVDVDNDED